ncbi:hypothetical protein TERTU_2888 [Teredinibacter turnerae T7901]|uniref:Uncharacterized protein n=1 Tax=Teredinibacter turnerae (strain ATCC 39867 / T7901) TaxID=377629 RepID=C5BNA4_TERTT|nr:hypothetical protein [Teredinibacter turnerae]ACR11756.1 hypothetical protein TERTU_2888 [Teredinibacter turnerae T7901]
MIEKMTIAGVAAIALMSQSVWGLDLAIELDTEVSGEYVAGIGYAQGITSNVANDLSNAFIGCEIEADVVDGTIGRCAAKLSDTNEEVNCITSDEGQLTAIAGLTDSSFIRFEVLGALCKKIIVENGSQFGAKRIFVF